MEFHPASFKIEPGEHQGKAVLWFHFDYDLPKINTLKALGGKWSQSQKCWYLSDNKYNRNLAGLPPKTLGKQALARISPENKAALLRMEETLLLKSYRPSTIRTYIVELSQLLAVLGDVAVTSLTPERLRAYMLYCVRELKLSENTLHSRLNAIKFYFEQVLHQDKFFAEIPRPKKPGLLPKVLSQEDIQKMLAAVNLPKHKLMLQLCYGMGLRVSEVVALKVSHIDSHRMQVLIAGAKGKKERYVPLPQTVLEALRSYYQHTRPKEYLFEGQHGGAYTARSLQMVFKKAMTKAGIQKKIGIHGLRHSYATHLHEYGTDIKLIQELLGHNDLKTTLLYTHVSQKSIAAVASPLDRMAP